VVAEDTRHSGRLLRHLGITTSLAACHEHNERAAVDGLVARLRAGSDLALISDAGTPLVSDPGFRLVRAARAAGVSVVPVPGPCAAIAALSVAGLPTDRFVFEGFLPARHAARVARLEALVGETRTLVFYEAGRRLGESVLLVAGAPEQPGDVALEVGRLLETLLEEGITVSRAAAIAARVSGMPKRELYARAQALHDAQHSPSG
jgi:16S rRNA (cytidine1402-2'-O)-methyltransferase